MSYSVDLAHPRNALERIVAEARRGLERRGYMYQSLYEITRHWRHFLEFAAEREAENFSVELAVAYVTDWEARHLGQDRYTSAVKRAMHILVDYHLHGTWDRHPERMNDPVLSPSALSADLARFLDYWRDERRVSRNTLIYGRRYLTHWLMFLEDKGINSWSQVTECVFTDFIASKVHMRPGSLELVSCVLRLFIKFLFTQGVVSRDWSENVPRFRRRKVERLPSRWTPEELNALLSAVDRASPVGKRDYAILLLACRLGMRASDIRTLLLDELHWERGTIEFSQTKTGRRATLPLTEEVGHALIDYLRHGRPVSEHREVFLRCVRPYEPFAHGNKFYPIITKYRRRAGIALRPDVARGMHSLRHTVATRLLEAEVPLETISDVLGHASLETTRVYARLDIAALRQVALGVEEVDHVH